jgi:hypothetical protein
MSTRLDISRKRSTHPAYLDSLHKFGSNPAVGTSSETVWSEGGLYPWASFPDTIYITGTDVGNVEISGLDTDYNEYTETVAIGSNSAQSFSRVFRMKADIVNSAAIYARAGSNTGTVVAKIDTGKAQTLMAVYTIPKDKVGYLVRYTVGCGNNDSILTELFTRDSGSVFRLKSEMSILETTITQDFFAPIRLEEKTDIDFRATSTQNSNNKVILNFDLILENS